MRFWRTSFRRTQGSSFETAVINSNNCGANPVQKRHSNNSHSPFRPTFSDILRRGVPHQILRRLEGDAVPSFRDDPRVSFRARGVANHPPNTRSPLASSSDLMSSTLAIRSRMRHGCIIQRKKHTPYFSDQQPPAINRPPCGARPQADPGAAQAPGSMLISPFPAAIPTAPPLPGA